MNWSLNKHCDVGYTLAGTIHCKCASAMHSKLKYMCGAVFGIYTAQHNTAPCNPFNLLECELHPNFAILPTIKKNAENELDSVVGSNYTDNNNYSLWIAIADRMNKPLILQHV